MLNDSNKNEPEDSLGERIFKLRQATGYSIEELSRQLGVRAKTLRNWETDRSEPRMNKLVSLAGILGVAPTYLIARKGYAGQTGIAKEPRENRILNTLKTELANLEQNQKEMLAKIKHLKKQVNKL